MRQPHIVFTRVETLRQMTEQQLRAANTGWAALPMRNPMARVLNKFPRKLLEPPSVTPVTYVVVACFLPVQLDGIRIWKTKMNRALVSGKEIAFASFAMFARFAGRRIHGTRVLPL